MGSGAGAESPGSSARRGRRAVAFVAALCIASGGALAQTPLAIWREPAVASVGTDRPAIPDIMGTVALHIPPNPTSTRWAKLMNASLGQPRLELLVDGLRALPVDEQVSQVQGMVARDVASSQRGSCSDDGYWAPAQETLARGIGDCFDVAIAKMEALRALGVSSRDLYLTTGRLRSAGVPMRETVALLVRVGERFWLLPDWSRQPLEVEGLVGPHDPLLLLDRDRVQET